MTNLTKKTVEAIQCKHCGNLAHMEIVARYSRSKKPISDDFYEIYREESDIYELLLCPSCQQVTLWNYLYSDWLDAEDITIKILYPSIGFKLNSLPEPIRHTYKAALKVRSIDANAYAVLLGRVLEMLCEDRKAVGKDLFNKLKDLTERGEIPRNLLGVADSLRHLRNVGAHASLGELTHDEVPILDDLCRAILEYIYHAPFLVEQAEKRLQHLKDKKSKE